MNSDSEVKIVQEAGLPPLINLLRSNDVDVQENAAGALRNLSENDQNKVRIVQEGALAWLVQVPRTNSPSAVLKLRAVLA